MSRVRFAVVLLLIWTGHASAWNTETQDDTLGWQGAYLGNAQVGSLPGSGWTKNEHSELSHVILKELGLDELYGLRSAGGGGITVTDLNSALYQPQVAAAVKIGDNPNTLLEERLVPNPAYFTGLPDYSWAVHDWINKNTLCPSLPPDAAAYDYCYLFAGWMGMLNANHFGTQAQRMYARYHGIALDLAARAKTLREALAAARFAGDEAAHSEFVLETEMEALIFESVGQHFLQDRWSTGHMWERWNGNDYATAAPAEVSFFVALASGLLHGSEGITKLPDPLGSPLVVSTSNGDAAEPVRWRLPGLDTFPGVGDYRLEDMHDGFFGAQFGFGDLPIDVEEQRARMFACAKAGWVEVIRGFGERAPGEWGSFGVPLPQAGVPVVEHSDCWEPWATNSAMAAGWLEHPSLSDIDKQARTAAVAETAAIGEIRERIVPLLDATWEIASRAAVDGPDETTLARGAIGPILGIGTGNLYTTIPAYTEPAQLDALPDRDPEQRGHDKHAIFGFFNRAHADWWCTNFEEVALNLRGSANPVDEAVCALLADRLYKGTDTAYRGVNREVREHSGSEGDPICRFHGVEIAGVDEDVPYHLHPGYVATPGAIASDAPTYESVVSWCRKLPVVDMEPCPEDPQPAEGNDAWDVVARVKVEGGRVALRGRNFGSAAGEVRAGAEGGPYGVVVPVASWSETAIQLDVPEDLLSEGDWFLQVCSGDDAARCSVGRAILRVGDEPCLHPLVGLWTFTDYATFPTSWGNYFFLPDGAVMSGSGAGAWFQIASWSVAGDTVTVEPCPDEGDNVREAPRFHGTWSAHPVTDEFDIVSCAPPNDDVCPAMRGTLSHVFPGYAEIDRGEADTRFFGSQRGYFPIKSTPLQDFRCHGGCRQTWEFYWPHACGPQFTTCGGRHLGPFVCENGVCPSDFECATLAGVCGCLTTPATPCESSDECPDRMFCHASGYCLH